MREPLANTKLRLNAAPLWCSGKSVRPTVASGGFESSDVPFAHKY